MATERVHQQAYESAVDTWGAGIAGGFVGGIAMGVVLHGGANVMPLIGSLYGWPTVLGGWVGHLINSVVLGLLFALVASHWQLDDEVSDMVEWAIYGTVYAAAIGLVTGGIMLPVTMNLMGIATLPEPVLPVAGVLGGLLVAFSVGVAHLVYGVILGLIYGYLHSTTASKRDISQ